MYTTKGNKKPYVGTRELVLNVLMEGQPDVVMVNGEHYEPTPEGEILVVTRTKKSGTRDGDTWYVQPGCMVPCRKFRRAILETPLRTDHERTWFNESVTVRVAW
jgi:hypothetical protein